MLIQWDARTQTLGLPGEFDRKHVAYGDTGKYWRWLQKELPPEVSRQIYSITHHDKKAKRSKQALEINFYPFTGGPTVVIKRRGFHSAATLALICLMAP